MVQDILYGALQILWVGVFIFWIIWAGLSYTVWRKHFKK
jgi:hypothetical protein